MRGDSNKEYTNGPDQVIPVNNFITWEPRGAVKLRVDKHEEYHAEPRSVPSLMAEIAKENGPKPALKVKDPDTNEEKVWSWYQYHEEVRSIAKAFINIGLQRFETVCILGFNSPEWVIADLAAIFSGGFAAGIYPTNGTDACQYILENSECSILVVEDQKQLDKIWKRRGDIPKLKKIIQYSGIPTYPGVLNWQDVLAEGRALPDDELESRLRRIAVNQCCTLVYTSGTTGPPKGVMLSHDNITWVAQTAVKTHKWKPGTRILSYLPLSHVAANLTDIFAPMVSGGTTFFADKNALKGSLKENLLWCKPNEFLGVPRVWEKIAEKMQELGRSNKGLKKAISTAAKETALKYHTEGRDKGSYDFFKKLVFVKVKKALGLDECRQFYTGAAPMDEATFKYFLSLDFKILELYGMSECTGPHTFQTIDKNKPGSCGRRMAEVKSKLVESGDPDMGDRRELWMWGRHVMMGYIRREDSTRKDMTEDGWLKSGDLAEIDSDGFHYIVGREKDLIITAGGENIPPQIIQEAVKRHLPLISQVFVIGDKQKFLSCFLTLMVEIDPVTQEPTQKLTSLAQDWCQGVGSSAKTVEDILRGPDRRVMAAIQSGIDRANSEATSNAQRIQKWTVLPRDFSLGGGEMGPTLKVKRNVVTRKYERCINKIYGVPQKSLQNGIGKH